MKFFFLFLRSIWLNHVKQFPDFYFFLLLNQILFKIFINFITNDPPFLANDIDLNINNCLLLKNTIVTVFPRKMTQGH